MAITTTLKTYLSQAQLDSGITLTDGYYFAKILTPNDDSGRHGVLIPTDAYDFFPDFQIADAAQNQTLTFESFDLALQESKTLAYKYYQRYPERRITRLNSNINDSDKLKGLRIQVFIRGKTQSGEFVFLHDSATQSDSRRFNLLRDAFFEHSGSLYESFYLVAPFDFNGIRQDAPLNALLERFDTFRGEWIPAMRTGSTGLGFTFESLMGVAENNDKGADFQGIELKTKSKSQDGFTRNGKLNLFQEAPEWAQKLSQLERLKLIGKTDEDGRLSCYSQITTKPNNLHLLLRPDKERIELIKGADSTTMLSAPSLQIGHWLHQTLKQRLDEKHSRAAFIFAAIKTKKTGNVFCYEDLVYCERPAIDKFVQLVLHNQIVFEFTMSQKSNGVVRNHGYPWRLTHEDFLSELFSVRVKLR